MKLITGINPNARLIPVGEVILIHKVILTMGICFVNEIHQVRKVLIVLVNLSDKKI